MAVTGPGERTGGLLFFFFFFGGGGGGISARLMSPLREWPGGWSR